MRCGAEIVSPADVLPQELAPADLPVQQSRSLLLSDQRLGRLPLLKAGEHSGHRMKPAAGRIPNVHGWGAEKLGLRLAKRGGFVEVDDRYETSVPGVFAAG